MFEPVTQLKQKLKYDAEFDYEIRKKDIVNLNNALDDYRKQQIQNFRDLDESIQSAAKQVEKESQKKEDSEQIEFKNFFSELSQKNEEIMGVLENGMKKTTNIDQLANNLNDINNVENYDGDFNKKFKQSYATPPNIGNDYKSTNTDQLNDMYNNIASSPPNNIRNNMANNLANNLTNNLTNNLANNISNNVSNNGIGDQGDKKQKKGRLMRLDSDEVYKQMNNNKEENKEQDKSIDSNEEQMKKIEEKMK